MTPTPLKKCQRPDCGGTVALVADERSDIESEWKCLMCGRPTETRKTVRQAEMFAETRRKANVAP